MGESLPEPQRQREFEDLVKATDPQTYENLPREVRPKIVRLAALVVRQVTMHAGPLPSPEQLAQYEKILPGAAGRIMAMAERQSTHRMELEKVAVPSQLNQSNRGQWMAFILAILFLLGALIAALTGHDVVAEVLGGTTIVSLATTFIVGQQQQNKSLQQKAPPQASSRNEE